MQNPQRLIELASIDLGGVVLPGELVLGGAALIIVALLVTALLGRRPRPSRWDRLPRRYTRHIEQRMAQRRIARADIERALAAPSRITRDRRERSVRIDARVGGRPLKVWVAEPWPPRDEIVLKSAAWGDVDG